MAKVTDVLGIVREYLEINRFDGLFCMDGDCACRLEDLAPCGDVCGSCEPGHLYTVKSSSGEEVTWRIMRREDVSSEPGNPSPVCIPKHRGPCLPSCRRLTRKVNGGYCQECRKPVSANIEQSKRGKIAIISSEFVPWLTPETPIEDVASGVRYRVKSIELSSIGDCAVLFVSEDISLGQQQKEKKVGMEKDLMITNMQELKDRVSDVEVFGDPGAWVCLGKASSKSQGWMKSTKVMQVGDLGVLVQVSTQHGDNIAEALTFVPGATIMGNKICRNIGD